MAMRAHSESENLPLSAPMWSSRTTASILPASRSSSVSPTQTMTERPASSACLVFAATSADVSFWFVRRSEWPRMTHGTPKSASMDAASSPVYAPKPVAEQSCAATEMSRRSVASTVPMWIAGTPTTTSTHGGMSPALLSVVTSAATLSLVPLHFQFPPMRYCLPGYGGCFAPGGPSIALLSPCTIEAILLRFGRRVRPRKRRI
mmetsp:Transcript_28108/g.87245  ORF Transcript_28108/g.87245 Transcript_28108/m.87245 type:complete len:204 (-) Transcript_28108:2-613(-)